MTDENDLGPCHFCDEDPVAGFNDVLFCEDHVNEGIGEAARVLAITQHITDPQRIAALAETMLTTYREADAAIENGEMQVGDTVHVNTGYDPSAN